MSLATSARSSSSLDRFLRHGSGSHSQTIYSKSPTKPKRLQSANLDELTGLWKCKRCNYIYPSKEPHHHQRRAHKKICEGGIVKRWLSGESVTEDTDKSQDTSNALERVTSTPETADTATSALTLGNEDKHDGADKVRDGDLSGTADGSRVPEELDWEQLLDGISNANRAPSGNESRMDSEIQEPSGEPALSEQSGIGGSGDNSEGQRKEELYSRPAHGKDLKPLISDPGKEGESNLSDEPYPDRSKEDFSFFPSSRDFDSGNREGRDTNMEDPSSLSSQNESDSVKASDIAPMDGVEGETTLRIESDDALKEGTEPNPLSHENGNEQADLGEDFESREPSSTPAAGVRSEEAEFLKQSEDDERDFRCEDEEQEGKKELLQDGDGSQLPVSEDGNAHEANAGTSEAGDMLTVAESGALEGKEEEAGIAQGITTNDQDGNDHLKQSEPRVAAGDGTQNESGDVPQNFHSARDVGDEASQNATLQGQSDPVEDATEEVGDLHGHEVETVGVTTLEPESEDEGVNEEGNTSKGLGKPSAASRNWDDWEHVVSGKDVIGEGQGIPLLQEIGEGGPLFPGVGLASNDQSNNLAKDSADTSASTPEEAVAGLKAGQSTGNKIGFQPAGVDWIFGFPDTVTKSVDKQLPESQSSGDHHFIPDQEEDSELIPRLSQADGTNGATRTAASQQQPDQPNKLAVRLSSAETNWDDWEDVIKTGPTLKKEGTTLKKAEDPESSRENQTLQVDSLEGGDVSESDQGNTGTILESESVEGGVDTASAGLPAPIPKSPSSDWLIDFSEPSMENNAGNANETTPGPAVSSANLEFSETKFFDLLELNEGSGQEHGGGLSDTTPVTSESEPGQSSNLLSKLSSAQRNWDDWEDVVRESERVSGLEKPSPLLESDLLGVGEHQNGSEFPSHADTNSVETGSTKPAGLVDALKSPPVVNNLSAAMNSGEEVGAVNQEADGLPKTREFLNSNLGQAKDGNEVDSKEDTSRLESRPAGMDRPSSAQEDWDDWEDVKKSEYVPAGSRQSSPSFEDAHDGELSSEHEYPDGRTTEVDLGEGKRRWADWEDLTKSEYMLLDGPRGEKLTFKRISDPSGSLSGKPLGRKISPSFEEPDYDGSASLNRNGRLQPFEDERSPSFRTLKSSSPTGVVKSDHSAGSNSFPGVETSRTSLPGSSSRKSDVVGMADKEPLVTKRPLIYRGSRRDYTSEVEDMEEDTSDPQHQHLQHHHDHSHFQQEEALKYDVEKILKGQTTYELICPICGALITRKIILRKKRRFLTERDPRWRRTPEITPVADDDANQSPRTDTSSQSDDATANWNKGIRCFGYLFWLLLL